MRFCFFGPREPHFGGSPEGQAAPGGRHRPSSMGLIGAQVDGDESRKKYLPGTRPACIHRVLDVTIQDLNSRFMMENEVKLDVEILPADAEVERVSLVPT